jgi:alkylhydroperoxidase family enzyme
MAWIRETGADRSPVMEVMSILPGALGAASDHNDAMFRGALPVTRVLEEAIATVVSVANRCRY